MSLSDLASLGSFVSGVAVLVSLVFLYAQQRQLGAQLAQTQANQRAMINEAYVTRASDMLHWSADPENASLTVRVNAGERSFTAEEITRLHLIFRRSVIGAQAAFQHYEAGLMDVVSYESAVLSLKNLWLCQPVYRALWARQAAYTAPSTRRLIDDMMREIPLAAPIDTVALFEEALSKVVADGRPPTPAAPV
jgi:hypothetical protein